MSQPVVTRFAPSPTGYLHIGGARTALFNWLYARGRGGKFLLRIEDTDRERSTPEATDAILKGMAWLGLDHDGDVISQFERADRHAEIANQLLSEGKAYKCFATQDEIAAFRNAAAQRSAGSSAGRPAPAHTTACSQHSASATGSAQRRQHGMPPPVPASARGIPRNPPPRARRSRSIINKVQKL